MSKKDTILYVGSYGHRALTTLIAELKESITIVDEPVKFDLPEPLTKYKERIQQPTGRAMRRQRRKNERNKRKHG